MGRRSNYAVAKDVQIKLRTEECALDMGQRLNYAAVQDAQIMPGGGECVEVMGRVKLCSYEG